MNKKAVQAIRHLSLHTYKSLAYVNLAEMSYVNREGA